MTSHDPVWKSSTPTGVLTPSLQTRESKGGGGVQRNSANVLDLLSVAGWKARRDGISMTEKRKKKKKKVF